MEAMPTPPATPPGMPPDPNQANSSINKLGDVMMGLTKMQENFMNQQVEIQQCKLDDQQTIHYTVANNLRIIGTIGGQNMATSMTRLAIEMMRDTKKHIVLELFYLERNDKDIHYEITPAMLEDLFVGSFSNKSSTTPTPVEPFSFALSFTGTRLQDIDVSLIYQHLSEDQDLSDNEKEAIYDTTYLIMLLSDHLTKVMKITAGIFEAYIGDNALLSAFYCNWANFLEENEEHIAKITRSTNSNLPAKIQAIIASVANEYYTEV